MAVEAPNAEQHRGDTFYKLPQRDRRMKSTNVLERLNEEIRRRTYVVRIFPNADSRPRLIGALGC